MTLMFCLHVLASTVVAYVLMGFWGEFTTPLAAFSLLFGSAVAGYFSARFRQGFEGWSWRGFSAGVPRWIEIALVTFVLFAAYRHFGWMLYTVGGEQRTLHANNFGDLPLHLNFIRFLADGAAFPPDNPIFASEKLRYPVGVDLYSALWESLRFPTEVHFFIFGMFATAATLVATRAWAGWWGIGGFFLGGGWLALNELGKSGTVPANALAWKNIFLSVFITQRGMLLAVPAGLWLLWCARRAFAGKLVLSRVQLYTLAAVWGTLPLFHLHSFLAVSVMLAGLVLLSLRDGPTLRSAPALKVFRSLLIVAVPIATLFVFYLTDGFSKAGVTRWRWGWMAPQNAPWPFFWLNFRVWLVVFGLLPLGAFVLYKRQPSRERARLLGESAFYLALFILFLNLMLAPWEWDNIKVLIWPYLGLLAVLRDVTAPLFSWRPWLRFAEPLVAVLLLIPGTAQVVRSVNGTGGSVRVSNLAELGQYEGALANVPRSAVLLTASTHDHPIAVLGRCRVLGYPGHLWSHGVDAKAVTRDLDTVMRGKGSWQKAAERLGATHILWGPIERRAFGNVTPPWTSILPNVSRVPDHAVYELPQK